MQVKSWLEWTNIRFAYTQGNNILDGTCLKLPPGRITVLNGASGSGKSTMLYLAAGLYPQNAGMLDEGCVMIDEKNVAAIPPEQRARVVGMMFQNPDLQFCMDTVINELIFCLENISAHPGGMGGIIDGALEFCGITHLKERKLITLSGGEKQKVMLACVVALRPSWFLLDEPFANIDSAAAREIAERLVRLQKTYGTGIVAVDHHLDIWMDIADEVVVLEKGGRVASRNINSRCLPEATLNELCVSLPGLPYQNEKPAKAPETRKPILQLKDMGVAQDGKPILSGCNASFYQGRVHAVVGKSGSGKSTLFSALCRLLPYSGSILVSGEELKKLPRLRLGRTIGFVFQNPQDQFVTNNVLDEVAISLKSRMPQEQAYAEAETLLREVYLWRYRKVSPYMLSQGQQRRLAVTAMLAYGCGILVCDEPTYAQDRSSLLAVMDSLQEQVVKKGLTLLFSTHDLMLARDYADILYEIRDGMIYEQD